MASVYWEMVSEMVTQLGLELEMGSGMAFKRKLIGHVCFVEIHAVWLALCLIYLHICLKRTW
jgi:hypothetical protein